MTYATPPLFSEVGTDSHGSATPPALTTVPSSDPKTPKQDQTIDPIETRESHHLSRSPEAPGQDTSGPAAAAETQPCSTGEARSDRDGEGGTPGAAPSHPSSDLPLDAPVRLSDPSTSVAAARTLDAANDRALVLDALKAIGGRGSADDVWDHLDRTQPARRWQRSVVSSRLSQLKDQRRYGGDPLVVVVGEKVGPSGRPVMVFGVVA
jgi:hypothetical protein